MDYWSNLPDCLKMQIFEFSDEFKMTFSDEVLPEFFETYFHRNVRQSVQILQKMVSSLEEGRIENFQFRQSKRNKHHIQVLLRGQNAEELVLLGEIAMMRCSFEIEDLLSTDRFIWVEDGMYQFGSAVSFLGYLLRSGSERFRSDNFCESDAYITYFD